MCMSLPGGSKRMPGGSWSYACSACCNCFVSGTSTACRELEIILSPLVELEVRGLPALQYFGQQVWQQSAAGQEAPQ